MNTAEEKKGFPARGRAQAYGWQWGRQGHGGVWGNKERDDPWNCQPLGPCSAIPTSHFTSLNPSCPDSEPEAIALRPASSFHRCRSRPRGEHTHTAGHGLHYFSHSTLLYRASQPLPSPVPGAGDTEVSGSGPALRHARPGDTKQAMRPEARSGPPISSSRAVAIPHSPLLPIPLPRFPIRPLIHSSFAHPTCIYWASTSCGAMFQAQGTQLCRRQTPSSVGKSDNEQNT